MKLGNIHLLLKSLRSTDFSQNVVVLYTECLVLLIQVSRRVNLRLWVSRLWP